MGKNHRKRKEANTSIENRGRTINIDFPNKSELIQFLADHLAYQYKKSFKDLEETNPKEFRRRISEVPEFRNALKDLIKWRLMLFKRVNITNESLILKIALKKAKIRQSPKDSFQPNIEYKVRGLKFERIEYKRG